MSQDSPDIPFVNCDRPLLSQLGKRRATATELLRSRWQRDPAAYDVVLAALHEQLSALRAPARSVVSRRRSVAPHAVEA